MWTHANGSSFTARLLQLPLLTWRDTAISCPLRLPEHADQALSGALRDPGLALDVWRTRDEVETAFCRFDCAEGRALLRHRGQREHVRLASDRAALAVLVQSALSGEDFAICYGEFARCIVPAELHLH